MEPPPTGVRVRMYDAAVGDCFLLAFRGADGEPVHMLIDCGVHSQVKGGSDRVRNIVSDIRRSTDDHLDLVVVTHEHGDHISGFHYGQDDFDQMQIDHMWFAWTEDEHNPLATRLDRARTLMLRGLRVAGPALAADGDPAGDNVGSLLSFFALDEGMGLSSRDTRDLAKRLVSDPQYLKPKGPPLAIPGVDGVRVFVLGPPEDERWLMRARPSSQPGEVYDDDHRLSLDETLSLAFLAAADGSLDQDERWLADNAQPFAGNHRVPAHLVQARKDRYEFFHQHYGFEPGDEEAWRRVGDDWQLSAESLALKLDAATNNTSLVLAIELRDSGGVLLFPGDAQVGNWQSWHDGGWSTENGLDPGEDPITAADLLARTVLYKVGHHGSHNATLRDQGLELMTSPDLSAIIPVDQKWALARKPHPWRMPFDPLYSALLERTKGRIVRADLGLVEPDEPSSDWVDFRDRVTVEDGYAEVDVLDT